MKLTEDECRILAEALCIAKYEFNTLSFGVFDKLNSLEEKLRDAGKDNRRIGSTSQDDFYDCMKRFAKSKI